jgi:sugar (pentulose or hexulose) kinase
MRSFSLLLAFAAPLALAGCHSAYIAATVSNRTSEPLSLIEVDYPSASFGTQALAPGQDFHYRFKVLGNGATTLLWSDSAHHEQKNSGPPLREGDEGTLTIIFNSGANPGWNLQLVNRKPN